MKEIIRIAIKGGSGYCPEDEAYSDKVTISRNHIRYECKGACPLPSWSHKSSDPEFQRLFDDLAQSVLALKHADELLPYVCDIGPTEFVITYEDKTKEKREYFLPGDHFEECFSIAKRMLPRGVDIPWVLMTSDDYEDIDD